MNKSRRIILLCLVAFTLAMSINFMPITTQAQLPDGYKSFENCWGSRDFTKSCTNGSATVNGCQPEAGSYCVGKQVEEIEPLP